MDKLNVSSSNAPSTNNLTSKSSSFSSNFFPHFAQSNLSHSILTPNTNKIWVIDSGVTMHMTGNSDKFTSYSFCSDKVHIADGSFQPVSGKGSIIYTPNIKLSSALHVPSFFTNLLSIHSITNDLNCKITFFPTYCIF